jgi:hypothetical protein
MGAPLVFQCPDIHHSLCLPGQFHLVPGFLSRGFEVHKPVLLRDFFPPVHIHLLAIIREIGWLREEDTYLQKYNIRTGVLVSVGVVKVFSSPSKQANGGPDGRESSLTVCGVPLRPIFTPIGKQVLQGYLGTQNL